MAGSGTAGYADGTRQQAKFSGVRGLVFDTFDKSLLICDSNNNRIRKVTLEGMRYRSVFECQYYKVFWLV